MRYVLGFDGGGTKTECVLMDETGRVVSRGRSGPSNPYRVGIDAASRALDEAANSALNEARVERSKIVALCAGLAGVGLADTKERMQTGLSTAFPKATVSLLTDLEIALAAAGDGPVIVLVAGTGSAAIGRNAQGQIARAGGYGPQLGDEGSAYDIGRRAIAAALRERDRTGADSLGGKIILEQLGCGAWTEVQSRARADPDAVFPAIFPVIAAAADAEDSVARNILRRAASELTSLVAALAERLGLGGARFLLAKAGGMTGRSKFFDAQLDAELKQASPFARIGTLFMSPAEAAARAARDENVRH